IFCDDSPGKARTTRRQQQEDPNTNAGEKISFVAVETIGHNDITFRLSEVAMPSFDIVSEVEKQEIDNALNQARKELATRFDFKGTVADIAYEKDKITLTAEDANRLRGLRE